MIHTDGFRALCLSRIDGKDAAAHRLRHVSTSINGYNKVSGKRLGHVKTKQNGRSIVNKHGLNHHGRSAEYFHVDI